MPDTNPADTPIPKPTRHTRGGWPTHRAKAKARHARRLRGTNTRTNH